MEKTSVYLDERHRQRLEELSRDTGRSQADIIREAIEQYQPDRRTPRYFAMDGIVLGPGMSIADIPEEELLEGFGED
jgi:hypothetical protein